jgi:uncharacterized membrane protein
MAHETARVEAFSDAVFAIAMTLLVLDLKAPAAAVGSAELARELARQWPAYLALLTSFATILIMWIWPLLEPVNVAGGAFCAPSNSFVGKSRLIL